MSARGLWREGGTTFPDRKSRTIAVGLAVAWALLIAARNLPSPSASQSGCRTDPWDFLRVGEIVEVRSLAFIVQAHCATARYSSDGSIELQHGGVRVDVSLQRLDIGGQTYFQIVSIGGIGSP